MATDNGTQVSGNGANSSGNGMGSGSNGDVGSDDLDQRLNARMDREWSNIRSFVDRNKAQVDQMRAEMTQLRALNQGMANQLQSISGYLTTAQEAELDPDEKAQRQQQRVQQSWLTERQQLALNARQQNAAFRVVEKISRWGYVWNDSRLDWHGDIYGTDPDAWAAAVIAEAADAAVQSEKESRKLGERQTREAEQRGSQESQQRQQTTAQNNQRAAQAANIDTSVPGGSQLDWRERIDQMTPAERKEYIRVTQNAIKHGKIEQPSQSLQMR